MILIRKNKQNNRKKRFRAGSIWLVAAGICVVVAGCSVDTVPISDTQIAYEADSVSQPQNSADVADTSEGGLLSGMSVLCPERKTLQQMLPLRQMQHC